MLPEMKGKVLTRLKHIVELQRVLEKHLAGEGMVLCGALLGGEEMENLASKPRLGDNCPPLI